MSFNLENMLNPGQRMSIIERSTVEQDELNMVKLRIRIVYEIYSDLPM